MKRNRRPRRSRWPRWLGNDKKKRKKRICEKVKENQRKKKKMFWRIKMVAALDLGSLLCFSCGSQGQSHQVLVTLLHEEGRFDWNPLGRDSFCQRDFLISTRKIQEFPILFVVWKLFFSSSFSLFFHFFPFFSWSSSSSRCTFWSLLIQHPHPIGKNRSVIQRTIIVSLSLSASLLLCHSALMPFCLSAFLSVYLSIYLCLCVWQLAPIFSLSLSRLSSFSYSDQIKIQKAPLPLPHSHHTHTHTVL